MSHTSSSALYGREQMKKRENEKYDMKEHQKYDTECCHVQIAVLIMRE
jgi:hypothetical protein